MLYYSPLRYPGGKGKLANYIKEIINVNCPNNIDYVEPYAGGASVALYLLITGIVPRIHINDLNKSIFAFWYSIVNYTDEFCALIESTPINIDEWYFQKDIQKNKNDSILELGFSTFFLNRTNRSGILKGGVIGGKQQLGPDKLDSRFNKKELIKRILAISKFRDCIKIYNLDAKDLLINIVQNIVNPTFIYLDPPYYVKGQGLYDNFYQFKDHKSIAELITKVDKNWIVSYDNVPEIKTLYSGYNNIVYKLKYSASKIHEGEEIMFFSDSVKIPNLKLIRD